jgi:hypothetical protein
MCRVLGVARSWFTIALIRGRKVQVEAWLPREYAAVEDGGFVTKKIAGGHIAQVRDLATGRIGHLSDRRCRDDPDRRAGRPRAPAPGRSARRARDRRRDHGRARTGEGPMIWSVNPLSVFPRRHVVRVETERAAQITARLLAE